MGYPSAKPAALSIHPAPHPSHRLLLLLRRRRRRCHEVERKLFLAVSLATAAAARASEGGGLDDDGAGGYASQDEEEEESSRRTLYPREEEGERERPIPDFTFLFRPRFAEFRRIQLFPLARALLPLLPHRSQPLFPSSSSSAGALFSNFLLLPLFFLFSAVQGSSSLALAERQSDERTDRWGYKADGGG